LNSIGAGFPKQFHRSGQAICATFRRSLFSFMLTRAIICAILFAFIGRLDAELPPWVYKERQDKAPEAVVIKVRSVTKREVSEAKWRRLDFTVEAEVQKVERSATKLSAGSTITIRYSRREYFQPIVGPSEIPALNQDQTCLAYLSTEGKTYVPAAGGQSFVSVP
jgi:hypothetical protein